MSEHTKEPWILHGGSTEIASPSDQLNDGHVIAVCDGNDKKSNARRIVACVNACAGIETDIIERNVGNVWKLLQQRDELLAALTHAVEIAENKRSGTWDDVMEYRKLISKAESELS